MNAIDRQETLLDWMRRHAVDKSFPAHMIRYRLKWLYPTPRNIIRDLELLESQGHIKREGANRTATWTLA